LEGIRIEGRIILKGISTNRMGGCRLGLYGSRMEQEAGCFEDSNGPLSYKFSGKLTEVPMGSEKGFGLVPLTVRIGVSIATGK
jgi:hypothetical protein